MAKMPPLWTQAIRQGCLFFVRADPPDPRRTSRRRLPSPRANRPATARASYPTRCRRSAEGSAAHRETRTRRTFDGARVSVLWHRSGNREVAGSAVTIHLRRACFETARPPDRIADEPFRLLPCSNEREPADRSADQDGRRGTFQGGTHDLDALGYAPAGGRRNRSGQRHGAVGFLCRLVRPLPDDGAGCLAIDRRRPPIRRVNVNQDRQLAARYGVQSIPCYVLLINGQEADRLVGATSAGRVWKRCFPRPGWSEPPRTHRWPKANHPIRWPAPPAP